MINLLRADFYKLFKSKVYLVITIIFIALPLFLGGILKFSEFLLKNPQIIQTLNNIDNVSVVVSNESDNNSKIDTESMDTELSGIEKDLASMSSVTFNETMLHGNTVCCMALIFICISICLEYSQKTIKNYVCRGIPRYKIYISKTTASAVGMAISVTAFMISGFLIGGLLFKFEPFSAEMALGFFKLIITQAVFAFSILVLFSVVAVLIRNVGGAIASCLGIVAVFPMLLSVVDMVLPSLRISRFSLVISSMSYNSISSLSGNMPFILILSLAYILIFGALGVLTVNKFDIK